MRCPIGEACGSEPPCADRRFAALIVFLRFQTTRGAKGGSLPALPFALGLAEDAVKDHVEDVLGLSKTAFQASE